MQNSNRREEAYIYISTALRLAISHGFHRESRLEKFAQSERVRLNRLWWTVYMQERRLAAATGNPSGINDEAIELTLPTNAPGFSPAAPLCTNIKIGRVVGRIISDLYGKEAETEQAFVSNVQDIVQTLYDISQSIPSELETSMRNSGSDLSLRTTAMLHLMLYQVRSGKPVASGSSLDSFLTMYNQATLLTIRPIMLHVTQLILENNISSEESLSRTPLGKLTETCIEAARRMLKAIITLKSKNMLVIFGFFDLESAVSAAVVMILMALYNSACPDQDRLHPTPGLNDALEVLQFLSDKGNIFAFQRLQEAQRLWELTRPFLQRARTETNSHNLASELNHRPKFATVNHTNNNENNNCPPQWETGSFQQPNTHENLTGNAANDASVINMTTLDSGLWDEISNIWALRPDPEGISLAQGESVTNPLTEDAYRYYYALYSNGQGTFVGDDMEGLTDLGRYLFNSGT
ncbi:unnamed protein product [Clonostachys solani]|uniref:Xylanolytic transcriptional activator regulatory domain-containing protein n=1 Tax=Clonostachys solani TaxID=160281 RepID=A0A9N9ZGA4_9HYPO|nr:unnamed protein product [Clonostachys solani]